MRANLVWLHRYIGLVMAAFLLVAGLTGALLSWFPELDSTINARLMIVTPPPGAALADPLLLRDKVQQAYPDAQANYVPLRPANGKAHVFFLSAPPGGAEPANNEVFVDPYSGVILGARKRGDLSQGVVNLMPFIYRLHHTLAIGTIGTWAFGIVAVLWTIDCFIGAWLTFPQRRRTLAVANPHAKSWLARWWPAWKVRWNGGSHKRNVDLHRAGGLWPWALLFVLAWSGVALNLGQEVYRPVMSRMLTMSPEISALLPLQAAPLAALPMGWPASLAAARRQVAAVAQREGLVVINEDRMSFDPNRGVVRLVVMTDRDINERYGQSSVYIDAATGTLLHTRLPTGQAAGDTITSWITTLHMASMWGTPFRILMTIVGLAVAMLSVTGVLIWWKKRRARRALHAAFDTSDMAPPREASSVNQRVNHQA